MRRPSKHLKTLAGKRRQVWEGRADLTAGNLRRHNLTRSKTGKIVSKRKSALSKRQSQPLKEWRASVQKACHTLGQPVTIKVKGTPAYALAKKIYAAKRPTLSSNRRRKSSSNRKSSRTTRTAARRTHRRARRDVSQHRSSPSGSRVVRCQPITCTLCMGAWSGPRKVCECGHSFHAKCLQMWMKTHDQCPYC